MKQSRPSKDEKAILLDPIQAVSSDKVKELSTGDTINTLPEGEESLPANDDNRQKSGLNAPGGALYADDSLQKSGSGKQATSGAADEAEYLKELLQRARRLDKVSSKTSCAEIMLRKGLITQKQLEQILEKHGKTKGYFHQIIADMELVPRDRILEVAAEGWGIEGYIDLEAEKEIDKDTIRMIPESKARRNLCIPVYKTETKLSIAMANPLDIFAADDIRISLRSTGFDYEIETLLAFPKDIEREIDDTYGVTDAMVQGILDEIQGDEIFVEAPEEDLDEGFDIARSLEAAQRGPIISLVNAILLNAVKMGVTDIHIEPFRKRSILRFRIDSRLREINSIPLPKFRHNAIVSRIKIMAGCDIAERRLPQDGRVQFKAAGKEYDLRVSIIPTATFGEAIVMRVADRSSADLSLSELGFLPGNLRIFEDAINQPYGLILVTGPTGSGKTTTLYSALNSINTPDIKILTVENPVERHLEGAIQVQTKSEIKLDFANVLRSFLRHDPDVIMLGEIRDNETAVIAIEAALTGHRVFSTLHTNDAASSIIRLNELGINEFLLTSSIRLAMAQRLVRKVCEKCKRPDAPTSRLLRELKNCKVDTSNLQIYKGVGCDYCGHTGLKGMTAIHELLYIDDDITELILKGSFSAPQIRDVAREKGMRTLREDGMEKVAKGITSFEEVILKTMDV